MVRAEGVTVRKVRAEGVSVRTRLNGKELK